MGETRLKILDIPAHPDDEIGPAGTLAKYARAGHSVTIAWMTRGDMGHMTLPQDELAKLRTKEGESSAKILGANCRFLGFGDSAVPYNREATMLIVDLIREIRPNIIITHSPDERHPDHRNTYANVVDAMHFASLPLLKTAYPAFDPDQLYFATDGDNAEIYVDITETADLKLAAAKCHKSQYEEWLTDHQGGTDKNFPTDPGVMYQHILDTSRVMGIHSGVKYAEGFVPFNRKPIQALDFLPLE